MTVALPDLHGRVALVTGASDGVGLEIASALAAAGAELVLPVRNREKGERAMAGIRERVPGAHLSLRDLDLARLASVRALIERLHADGAPLSMLVLNAGIVMLGDRRRHVTEDGWELHVQTNFLGHAVLTLGILPLLRAGTARVAVQGSLAAGVVRLRPDDLTRARPCGPFRAYGASKVALDLFACELARRSAAGRWGLTVHLCHPGIAPDTAIAPLVRVRAENSPLARFARRLGNTPARAADPALQALVTDAAPPALFGPAGFGHLAGASGPQRLPRRLADPVAGRRMWEFAASAL